EGNGQTPLIEVLTGLKKANSGKIIKDGKEVVGDSFAFIENRIGHIPEDRLTRGLIPQLTINQNLILGYHHREAFTDNKGFLKKKDIETYSEKAILDYGIKTPNGEQPASSLSGGNQQKIVVARVIEQNPDVLIIAQPTRGVDVGATEYIHHQILELKEKGKAVLLISADLDEVMNLSDRIAVIYDGSIVKVFDSKATANELGLAMAGVVQ
ncbi:MAG: ATP-binding cassette domain-containing protein, partial [Sphaerochaetaceae bacterium]|nr:ATP-binding cassette domain-containing protein [Sphaerochaetaceae bacterium]